MSEETFVAGIISNAEDQARHRTASDYDFAVIVLHSATLRASEEGWDANRWRVELTEGYRAEQLILPEVDLLPALDMLIDYLRPLNDTRLPTLELVRADLTPAIDG